MSGITKLLVWVVLVASFNGIQADRFYGKCQLARQLRQHGIEGTNLAAWVCLADVHTNGRFDTLHKEGNGYGLWEISSKNWCGDGLNPRSETSRCNLDCDRFWDGNFEDDIRCFTQMFVEKGYPEFRGWKVRHSTCPRLELYLRECGL